MSWIEEIGEKELSDKHVQAFIMLLGLAAENDKRDEASVRKQLVEYCDTAITNLTKIKQEAEGVS